MGFFIYVLGVILNLYQIGKNPASGELTFFLFWKM